jgi:hypothetical protein
MVQHPEWRSDTVPGREQLAAACVCLSRRDVPERQRLGEAARLFWKALFHKDEWPELVRSHRPPER